MNTLFQLLVALSSGVLFAFVSPPVNLAWAHWFMWLPVFWALRQGEGRKNAALGYASGWLATFLLYFWLVETIVRFSSLPWGVGLAVHVLYATAFAVPYIATFGLVHWLRHRLGLAWVFVIPALHVALEKIGPQLFPYYQGVTQYRQPWVWQLASVFSVMGVSYLVMLTNTALAEVVYRRREGRPLPWPLLGGVAAAFALNLAFGAWRYDRVSDQIAAAPAIRASILQHDVTMEERMRASAVDGLKAWIEVTREIEDEQADLVIWPEGAVSFNPNGERKAKLLGDRSPLEFFSDLAKDGGYDFIIGGGTINRLAEPDEYGRRYEAYNSVYSFTDDGGLDDRYDKMVPLPFGEYVPLSDTFPFLKGIIQGPGDFRKGTRPTLFVGETAAGHRYTYSIPICYEAILERAMWDLYEARDPESDAQGPVDLFVNVTNDAWFGDTASPHQHAMLTTVQAMHFGRPLLRLAYTGVSWVVQPNGDILYETEPFTEVADVVELRLPAVETLYVRGGWLFPWLCVGGTLVALVVARRRGPPGTPDP
jgi:apolipoprotein N-acyltransferase